MYICMCVYMYMNVLGVHVYMCVHHVCTCVCVHVCGSKLLVVVHEIYILYMSN